MSDQQLKESISQVFGTMKAAWPSASKVAVRVVEHSLENSHSMNVVDFSIRKALDANHGPLLACLKQAFKDCLCAEYEFAEDDHDKLIKVTYNKNKWKKIERKEAKEALAKLRDTGLTAWQKPKSKDSGSKKSTKTKMEFAFAGTVSLLSELQKYPQKSEELEKLEEEIFDFVRGKMTALETSLMELGSDKVKGIVNVYLNAMHKSNTVVPITPKEDDKEPLDTDSESEQEQATG